MGGFMFIYTVRANTLKFIGVIGAAVLALCILLTAAHVIYAVWAYQHCSIIYFIGGELW